MPLNPCRNLATIHKVLLAMLRKKATCLGRELAMPYAVEKHVNLSLGKEEVTELGMGFWEVGCGEKGEYVGI